MRYIVKPVEESDLPVDVDWAYVRSGDGSYMFIKRSMFQDPERVCATLLRVRELAHLVVEPAPLALAAG
jgi:hypothetical protein